MRVQDGSRAESVYCLKCKVLVKPRLERTFDWWLWWCPICNGLLDEELIEDSLGWPQYPDDWIEEVTE
jgi:hypothetical protein